MRNSAGRSLIVVLSLAAWFALSNHCALGALPVSFESASEMSGCPMHSAPAKKKSAPKTPCCKDLRAVVAKCVKAAEATQLVTSREYVVQRLAPFPQVALEIEALDTGPPVCFSFAESVLQVSMLSHAPPVS